MAKGPILVRSMKGLNLLASGYIEVAENGALTIPGIFAGGDISTGAATVISAMGMGKHATRTIHDYVEALAGVEQGSPAIAYSTERGFSMLFIQRLNF